MRKRYKCLLACMLVISLCGAEMLFPANVSAGKIDDCYRTRKMSDSTRYAVLGTAGVLAAVAFGLLIWRTVKDNQEKSDRESPLGMSGSGMPSCPERYQKMVQPVFYIQENALFNVRSYGLGFQKSF
jgi:hypothetical protein